MMYILYIDKIKFSVIVLYNFRNLTQNIRYFRRVILSYTFYNIQRNLEIN